MRTQSTVSRCRLQQRSNNDLLFIVYVILICITTAVSLKRIPPIGFVLPSKHQNNNYHYLLSSSRSAVLPSRHQHNNHHYFSSSRNDAWNEVLQNAVVGAIDKRQVIKKDRMDKQKQQQKDGDKSNRSRSNNLIQFVSPLLEDGYPPAVLEYEQQLIKNKPILLYLPGFDGTILAPFLQFPSLSECFDVRALKIGMDDRSTFEELKHAVIDYLMKEYRYDDEDIQQTIYLLGESFGGILATEVALELSNKEHIELGGLILVNPATSYLRSSLYELGPSIANAKPLFPILSNVQYVFSLVTKLVPLFLDEGRAIQQLITILTSKGLPSVVNNPQREAYMGRVAFDLGNRLKLMPKETLKWRLEEWLEWGNGIFEDRFETLQLVRDSTDNSLPGDVDTYNLLKVSQELRTLIVVGELDLTLPSIEEANRLSTELFRRATVHKVLGAGHASTCGGSLNLIELLRDVFPEVDTPNESRIANYKAESLEELNGLEPRYDGASIGLNPLLYWSKDYYREWRG